MKGFIAFFLLFFCFVSSARNSQALELEPSLKRAYLALLAKAPDFHKAISEGNQEAVQKEIRETQEIIAGLYRQILSIPKFHHKIHSHKLLKSIEDQLSLMNVKNSFSEIKDKQNMKKLFNSFFELAEVYNLKKDMGDKIFYCSKDRSLWFQKEAKANNPINPHYKSCGRLVL